MALGLSFEVPSTMPSQAASACDDSHEVSRLLSVYGLVDPRRALRLGSIRLSGSPRMTV
jgi:hypothetical protein